MRSAPNPVSEIILVRTAQASLATLALHWLCRWPLTGPHALGLFFTPLLCLYFVFVFVAPWSWGLPIWTRLKTRERVVALTFDDGPSPETTPRILDILRAHGVTATFFVLGEAVERNPDILQRIVREGHGVGLHGDRHRALTLASASALMREVTRAAEAVQAICPSLARPTLFRPPYGFKSLTMPWRLRRHGFQLAAWSLNPRDYHRQTPEELAGVFLDGLHPGAIALLHDGPESAKTVLALPLILAGLADRGWRCVLLPQETVRGQGVDVPRARNDG